MTDDIKAIETQISDLKKKLAEARATAPAETVKNFEFVGPEGTRMLSDLFGDHEDLILIHNMGQSCSYCTLWADGFSGYQAQLSRRAAFVLVSPDDPATQSTVAKNRGWTFPMVQDADKEFSTAMGTWSEKEGWWPGVSGFHKNSDGTITRTGFAEFGPGDDFCMVWPMFELLKDGSKGWEPV